MSEKHVAELTALAEHGDGEGQGCVCKCVGSDWKNSHGSYRKNGYDETLANPRKKALYNVDFTNPENGKRIRGRAPEYRSGFAKEQLFTAKDPRDAKHRTAWWIGLHDNYFQKAYRPFNHDAHHILPWDAIQRLPKTALKLLMAAGYNLNAGNNIIILPKNDSYARALMLPAHPYDHPEYSSRVAGILEEIQQDMAEEGQGHELNEDNVGNLRSRLEAWQQQEYWKLVRLGELASLFAAASTPNDAPMARH